MSIVSEDGENNNNNDDEVQEHGASAEPTERVHLGCKEKGCQTVHPFFLFRYFF